MARYFYARERAFASKAEGVNDGGSDNREITGLW